MTTNQQPAEATEATPSDPWVDKLEQIADELNRNYLDHKQSQVEAEMTKSLREALAAGENES